MSKQQRRQEQLAIYRELSPAERERLQAALAGDPEAAELLAAYREMDRRLAELPHPAPDPALRRDFYKALERERARGEGGGFPAILKRAPALAAQGVVGAVLVLLLIGFAYLFRQQQVAGPAETPAQSLTGASEETATPVAGIAEDASLPAPTLIPQATPTPAVAVDPADPFAPFRQYMLTWPDDSGMAYGALRAGMIAYLQQVGSMDALADPVVLADLQAQIAPALPEGVTPILRRAELDPVGPGEELVVAALPFVDVYRQDQEGVFHVEGLSPPRYWPVAETWPAAVEAIDFSGDGVAELLVTYNYDAPDGPAQEVVVAHYVPQRPQWVDALRVPLAEVARTQEARETVPAEVLFALPASPEGPGTVETYCLAYGAFDTPATASTVRRDVHAWTGGGMGLLLFDRTPARNLREYVNVAEAYLEAGQLREALRRYTLLYTGELGEMANAPGAERADWRGFAALRALQLGALLGDGDAYAAAKERVMLSSSQSGLLGSRFAGAYDETGSSAAAWAALLADPLLYEAAGGDDANPGTSLRTLYGGLALAAALREADLPQTAEALQPEQLLALWESHGLTTNGRVADMDLDGAPEIVAALQLPPGGEPELTQVWLLDVGEDGWFAAPLGALPALRPALPEPVPGPDGSYLLMQVGATYAGWDGRYVHHFQESTIPGEWLRSTEAAYRCPLRALELVVVDEAILNREAPTPSPPPVILEITPTPVPLPPTATPFAPRPGGVTQPPGAYPPPEVTPTPWDGHQNDIATPTPLPPPPGSEPVVDGPLRVVDWSPDGRYLAFLRESAPGEVELPQGFVELTFYDTTAGSECPYPIIPFDFREQSRIHAWTGDGRVLLLVEGRLMVGQPCVEMLAPLDAAGEVSAITAGDEAGARFLLATASGGYQVLDLDGEEAGVQPLSGITASAGDEAAFAPVGPYVGIHPAGGGSVVFSVETGEVVQAVDWSYPPGSMLVAPFRWLDERVYAIAVSERGPLLVDVEGEAQPLPPALFDLPASPEQQALAVRTAAGDGAVLLQGGEEGPWLFRSGTGTAEPLAGESAQIFPTGVLQFRSVSPTDAAAIALWWMPFAGPSEESIELRLGTADEIARVVPAPVGDAVALLGENEVRVVSVAGERVFALPDVNTDVAWSPDGRVLAVSGGGGAGLFLLRGAAGG